MNKYLIIKKYIDEFDYYDLLKHGALDNEFDIYSKYFCDVINKEDSVEKIAETISNRMDRAFGNEVRPDRFIDTAKKIKDGLIALNV